ncbi:hypothetical protein E8K88_11985 [Lampropedia aestuarii]|uniref:Uncharacterized protein n=1 Tax=Lampropedia aestuarii TaxID=2562762 RepID=A0A4S5BMW7_9BURK|nr:hypothetical protein [Lampropedia aestuarii]THJ32413.1 hypothetical protein E8K88_11985 [Lampropedia aestuarii]
MKYILFFWCAWNVPAILLALFFCSIPWKERIAVTRSMLNAAVRGTLLLPIDFIAPAIVPIGLLFTKWEDEKLPKLFRLWDNDVSINGDLREPDGALSQVQSNKDDRIVYDAIVARNYWAKGQHPRSFWSRYVWLGWRNRASWLAMKLGKRFVEASFQQWGDPATGNGHPGRTINEHDGAYQLYIVRKFGPFQFRFNWGFKIWGGASLGRTYAPVVNTSFSLKRWKAR